MFKHLKDVRMTYVEHIKFSFYLSYMFGKASFSALVHGVYPDILITTSSDTINKLSGDIKEISNK
jgi:hypothetical protein